MKKISSAYIFVVIGCCKPVAAQLLRYSISMPYVSVNAYSRVQQDVFSFTGNQAAIAAAKNAGAGVYAERRFLLAENSSYALAAVFPGSLGNFGIKLNYAGFARFNEYSMGVAYGRSLGSRMDIGIQFNYYGYRIAGYGNTSSVNFELGSIMRLSAKLNAGVHIYNPVGSKLGKSGNEKLAYAYRFGLGYDASDYFFIGTEIIKEEGRPVNVNASLQYQFQKHFFVRIGCISETGSAFGGAGISWKNIRLDLSCNYHPQLGFTPGLLLISDFKKKKS